MGALIGPALSIGGALLGGGGGGGMISNLFGGGSQRSNSSSLSENQAYPMLSQALSPQVNNATGSSNQMASLLGLNGGGAQNAGFDNWRNSTGYQFGMDQGVNAITGSAAAKGLLNSGATAKAVNTFGQNYADTQFGNYFNQLLGLGNMGNNAAQVIEGAGQRSTSQSSSSGTQSTGGLGKGLGSLLSK